MTVFSVNHKTTYRYKRPIRPGLHQLLFRPRDSFDQRLLDCRLKVVPEPAEVRWIHDVFGNCLTLVDFDLKCELLEFETFIRLEHTPENAPDFRIEDCARSHPFSYSEDETPDLAAYIRRQHPQDIGVEEWLEKFLRKDTSRPDWATPNDAQRSNSRRVLIPTEDIPRNAIAWRNTQESTRHLQRLCAINDGSGASPRVRGSVRYRLRLRANSRRAGSAWGRLNARLVSDLRARIRVGRI